jgi:hypothetical protein
MEEPDPYNPADDANWYNQYAAGGDPFGHSRSWTLVQDLFSFLTLHLGNNGSQETNSGVHAKAIGAWSQNPWGDGLSPAPAAPSPVSDGDVYFYVWAPYDTTGNDNFEQELNHSTIVSSQWGKPTTTLFAPSMGTLIDAHDQNHLNEWYPLWDWNVGYWAQQIEIQVHFTE